MNIAVQQFSFEIQPAPFGSVAPTYSADLPECQGKPTAIPGAAPELTWPLFLAANKLLCQCVRHLILFLFCGHGAQLLSTCCSFPLSRALRERLRNKGVQPAWLTGSWSQSPRQVACTVSSTVSGLRRGGTNVCSLCTLLLLAPKFHKCRALGMGLRASSILPFLGCHFMLFRHSSLSLKSHRHLQQREKNHFMGLSVGGNELKCVGEHL